jgi:CRP/FNR family cyclic AMP-dependent transcriptional regulator
MPEKKDLILYPFLKEINLFEGISNDMINRIFKLGKLKYFKGDTVIISEGDDGGNLHILVSGKAEVWKSVKGGLSKSRRLAKFECGSIFGEMSVFDGAPYSASVKASGECVALVIQGAAFKRFLKKNPEPAYRIFTALIGMMSNRIRRANLTLSLMESE